MSETRFAPRLKHPETGELDGVEHVLKKSPEAKDPRLEWLYEQITKLNEVDRSLTLLLLDAGNCRSCARSSTDRGILPRFNHA